MKNKDAASNEIHKNTLNTYLTSSLSLELVNVILSSIVSFTDSSRLNEEKKRKTAIEKKKQSNASDIEEKELSFDLSPFKKELLGEQPFDMIAEMKINRIEFYHEEPSLSKKK
jgi:hypothetical protein